MKVPIEARIFLVPAEEVDANMATLAASGTPAVTFTHVSGAYSAIAVDVSILEPAKKPKAGAPVPPPVPSFLGGQ